MTTPIPAAEAIRGLVRALKEAGLGCDCRLMSTVPWERHDPDCVRYVTGAALDAFERRAPLRDSSELRAAVLRVLREVEEGRLPAEMGVDEVLALVDSALFGTAAKEGSRG